MPCAAPLPGEPVVVKRGASANLGFDVAVVQDAVFGFGITGPDGRAHDPEKSVRYSE